MSKSDFPYRLLFDEDFYYQSVKKIRSTPSLLLKLMYINSNSRKYSRRHNAMSESIFKKILKGNSKLTWGILRASFFPLDEPEFEKIEDEIERNIKYAIYLASEDPFKTIILTTPDKAKKYEENKHYINVKEISIKSGEDALALIDSFWKECTQK